MCFHGPRTPLLMRLPYTPFNISFTLFPNTYFSDTWLNKAHVSSPRPNLSLHWGRQVVGWPYCGWYAHADCVNMYHCACDHGRQFVTRVLLEAYPDGGQGPHVPIGA
jgi:hypothetical protein